MARFFTGTDRGVWGATGIPINTTSWSNCFWSRQVNTPVANARWWDASLSRVSRDSDGTVRLNLDYSTTDGVWACSYANQGSPVLTDWHHYCWTHVDGSSAKFYLDGSEKTVTQATAPSGTRDTTTAQTLYVGNIVGLNRAIDCDLAWLGFYSYELQYLQVSQAMYSGFAPTPRWLYPLLGDSPEPNYSGVSKSLTITGSTVKSNPRAGPSFINHIPAFHLTEPDVVLPAPTLRVMQPALRW